MNPLKVPENYSYVAAFLTMKCNLNCFYCINTHDKPFSRQYKEMSTKEWINAINRLDLPEGLPVTLQGGEPTVRKDFFEILKGIRENISLDILTNGQFDIDRFIREIPPERFRQFEKEKEMPFASLRVSYHPTQISLENTIQRVLTLKNNKYSVGVSVVHHPLAILDSLNMGEVCREKDIFFWEKEFLGFYEGKLYGTYAYPDALAINVVPCKSVECRISDLLIAPDGNVYRCHRDLYHQENPIGHILDDDFKIEYVFRPCDKFGQCNPCDIKLKTDLHLKEGYTSVEIRGLKNEV